MTGGARMNSIKTSDSGVLFLNRCPSLQRCKIGKALSAVSVHVCMDVYLVGTIYPGIISSQNRRSDDGLRCCFG